MNAIRRTFSSLKVGQLGITLLFALTTVPATLQAQKTTVPVGLPTSKTNAVTARAVVPGPPILHHGVAQAPGSGSTAAADADDVRQDAQNPTHAFDITTGQELAWDADKESWVDSKTGQSLGFDGVRAADGSIIPAPPVLHHGVVEPAVDGINARTAADDVHQYEADPTHAYDRTTHASLYWYPKNASWVDATTGHALGFDGAPVVSPASAAPVQQAATPAQAPASRPAPRPAPRPVAAAGLRADYSPSFTLGWAGGASWIKPTGALAGGNPQTVTSIAIPAAQYLVQWNAARRLSLGFYLGGSYLRQSAVAGSAAPASSTGSFNFGLEPDLYFVGRDRSNSVRLFVGPGLWYNYAEVGGTTASSSHQLAASGMLGAELPIWREGRMRVGVEYGHDFQNSTDNLAAANYYALDLGLMFDAPGGAVDDYTDYANAALPAFSIRYGSELGFTSFGAVSGVSAPTEFAVALPTQTVGGYAGLGSTRQLRIGSELDFTRLSGGGTSATFVGLEPGVEYYVLRHAYRGWDVRVRGFGVLEYDAATVASGGGYSASTHGWLSGYGGEGMLTHHFFGPQLVGFGVSYAHVGDNASLAVAAQNTLNFKVTIDSKLF